jgi:penicillin amidase
LKILKRILAFLAVLLILVLVAGFFFMQHLKPDYDGEMDLPGLKGTVSVYYDDYGIPHIYADNESDAFRALGYVHAQDRLWQMELLRRVAPGRLSEVFGPDALPNDRLFLNLGIDDATRETLASVDLSQPAFRMAQAYLDGVNHFIETGPAPVEFYLTGIEKETYTLQDVYNSIGYMAFSFAMAHKTDPFLSEVGDRLGADYVRELLEASPSNGTYIRNYDPRGFGDSTHVVSSEIGRLLESTPLPALEGSNSWVLGPGKTRSGEVILANDPHIGFAQPSVWFEAHIITPDYEKYGYHLAGIPFPLLGHDRNLAYGLTMFENDDIDFYQESLHPQDSSRYERNGEWKAFRTVEKSIPVKGEEDSPVTFQVSDRGPVINSVIESLEDKPPVSISWVYTQGENKLLEALYGISHSQDLRAFEQAVTGIHAPGLNVMYGDAKGNVAWWGAARLHRMPDSVSTKLILDGPRSTPLETLPFSHNPKSINPPWGYVYSANNQPDSSEAGQVPGYYLPENRARRIVDLIEPKNDWDREAVMDMIMDVTSSVNPEVIRGLASGLPEKSLSEYESQILDALMAWDGAALLDSKEAVVFHRWVYYWLEQTFGDELGRDGFESLMRTHLVKRLIAPMSTRENSLWWDDVRTPDQTETRSDIASRSFREALSSINRDFGGYDGNWGWEDVHTLEHQHPFGRVAALRSFFNVGPYPVHGTREVINNLMFPYDSTGYYRVSAGPSTRRIIDFSDLGESRSILPTGQSGNPLSPHYDDQAELYVQGRFRKMLMEEEEIRSKSESVLILKPVD